MAVLCAAPSRLVPDEKKRSALLMRMSDGAGHSREGFANDPNEEELSRVRAPARRRDQARPAQCSCYIVQASAASASRSSQHAAGDSPPTGDVTDGKRRLPRKPHAPTHTPAHTHASAPAQTTRTAGVPTAGAARDTTGAPTSLSGSRRDAAALPSEDMDESSQSRKRARTHTHTHAHSDGTGTGGAPGAAPGAARPHDAPIQVLALPAAANPALASPVSAASDPWPRVGVDEPAPPSLTSTPPKATQAAARSSASTAAAAPAPAPAPAPASRVDIRGYLVAGGAASARATRDAAPAISHAHAPTEADAAADGALTPAFSSRNNVSAGVLYGSAPPSAASSAPAAKPAQDLTRALAAAKEAAAQASAQLAAANDRIRTLEHELDVARSTATQASHESAAPRKAVIANLRKLLLDVAYKDAVAARSHLAEQQARLGRIITTRQGASVIDAWEDGEDFIALRIAEDRMKQQRADLERVQKELLKRNKRLRDGLGDGSKGGKGKAARTVSGNDSDDDEDDASGAADADALSTLPNAAAAFGLSLGASQVSSVPSAARGSALAELDLVETEEGARVALATLKKDEAALVERRKALEAEKLVLLLDIKRSRAELGSKFRGNPVLGERYMLMQLLGKGGFSEVWRAMDLHDVSEVAVKIHQLSPHWSEDKKRNYVKHAMRELEIQREMEHPNVVHLHDAIEIDSDTFATVLEFCRGGDLEKLLKSSSSLQEREARAILMQVLSALRYLNGYTSPWTPGSTDAGDASMPPPKRRIIHYDLKPANILFDDFRNAKVTDFGLSKVLEDDEGATSMELTSQGAGTYWYLPPECFHVGVVRISSKVDVWSVGVIFYQMLFGKRPFAEGHSQEAMVASGTLLQQAKAGPIFPPKPTISAEAKAFIRRCLTADQAHRPDVLTICEDPYLRMKMRS